jgi:hypothetical protein
MLIKFLYFISLAFILPIILLISYDSGSFSLNFIYIYILVLWTTFRVFFTGLLGDKKLSLLFFYVFIYVFLCIQPMLSIWVHDFPHGNKYMSDELIFSTISLIILGIFSFELSYNFGKYIFKFRPGFALLKDFSNHLLFIKRTYAILTFVLIIFLISIPIYGPYLFLGIRDGGLDLGESRGIERSTVVDLLLVYGLRTLAAIALFRTIFFFKNYGSLRFKKNYFYLLISCIFINLVISNPLNAPRLWTGALMLSSCFIFFDWNRGSFSKIFFYLSIFLLLLFSGTDPRIIFGRQLLNENQITFEGTYLEIFESIKRIPSDYNFDSFQVISFTQIYCEKNSFSYGRQILLPLFFWIPRVFWPNKPIGTPDMVAGSFDLPNLNISSPLWAEGYVNFGFIGVILFFIVLGSVSYLADCILMQHNPSVEKLIFSIYFASNMIILLRGDLTTGTQYLQTMFLLLFLVKIIFYSRIKFYA